MDMLIHYPTCNPNYPEKPADEAPQSVTYINIGDGELVAVCNDCGAIEPIIGRLTSTRINLSE